ncbi:tetratricopeptide repeat protein [Phenylobacterium sp.]|jgi:predicted O-linked N-acetylglucosamine transferase (SPINDLY family)|uniref:O-linked N-acetylglucosamine transferase, SPINDLY family protein n=1 Tax=Phenylobacterium sp. TaxID=1871053 RepID=UPI002E330CCE|nr:tetratricopeptide repeat protein [Phenylobacterium sp.]HEX3364025.1 tetratricopeptide repeat protein [Phenylobacterium sp.]
MTGNLRDDAASKADDWQNLGVAHYRAGRFPEAEAAMRAALTYAPGRLNALVGMGAILRAQRRLVEALEFLDAARAVDPDAPQVAINRANVLNDLQRWDAALEAADRALIDLPDHSFANNARGNALAGLGRFAEALENFQEAVRLAPDNMVARYNCATMLLRLDRADEALAIYDATTAATPKAAKAWADRGHLLMQQRRWAKAVADYDRAFDLDPNLPNLAGQRLHARMKLCDWRDFDSAVADLGLRIDAGKPASLPFSVIAAALSPRQQLRCATVYSARTFAAQPRPAAAPPGRRIRIGYFSADFHEHATAHLMAEMVELHDRQSFDVAALSFGPPSDGPMRSRLKAACERFYDVEHLTPAAISEVSRGLPLDIAVDLKGFTTLSRPKIFAAGVAPIQVSFLGYPMTTGAPFIDYLIADRTLIAADEREFYSEKIAWLPGCYQPNDRKRPIAGETGVRADHGLPDEAFVFASFNNAYKITPSMFGLWMDLLRAVPGSVLWLLQAEATAMSNLTAAAEQVEVDPGRLVFAPLRPLDQHLARIGHADLFLDTSPCCAHTTASDSLWAGLPLLTLKGETFAGRVAASLLTSVGLPELIVEDTTAYRDMALVLARNPKRLADLRARLARARGASALFDTPTYVRGLEDLYRAMHDRRLAGLAPAHLP